MNYGKLQTPQMSTVDSLHAMHAPSLAGEMAKIASRPAKTRLASEPAKLGICWIDIFRRLKYRGMVLASHVIFTAYGFWLPNDPRGSWSEWVASWELLKFGRATKTQSRRSVAAAQHDAADRRAAKAALKRPPVQFDGRQARAIARGVSMACRESGYVVRAFTIMPDHAHAVVARHDRLAERIVGHFKSSATKQLRAERLHPFDDGGERVPTVWAEGCWKRFLNDGDALMRAIDYVNGNPARDGLSPQSWSFIYQP